VGPSVLPPIVPCSTNFLSFLSMPKLRRDLLVLWSFWITTVQFSFSLTKNKEIQSKTRGNQSTKYLLYDRDSTIHPSGRKHKLIFNQSQRRAGELAEEHHCISVRLAPSSNINPRRRLRIPPCPTHLRSLRWSSSRLLTPPLPPCCPPTAPALPSACVGHRWPSPLAGGPPLHSC
jgi:hypothetical protein